MLAKVLTERLKKVIGAVSSQTRRVGCPGRSVSMNLALVRDINQLGRAKAASFSHLEL